MGGGVTNFTAAPLMHPPKAEGYIGWHAYTGAHMLKSAQPTICLYASYVWLVFLQEKST